MVFQARVKLPYSKKLPMAQSKAQDGSMTSQYKSLNRLAYTHAPMISVSS